MSPPLAPALLVSPHFDDAVFSCGAMLAANPGTVVLTIFTGQPETSVSTDWDARCGFADSSAAMDERTLEDSRALNILDAFPERANFLDSQYVEFGMTPSREAIAHSLTTALDRHDASAMYLPLGLFHSDHKLVHGACCDVWRDRPSLTCIAYEDALYRRMDGLLQERLSDLAVRRISATPVATHWRAIESHQSMKRAAVRAYVSQLKAFGPDGYDDVFCVERFWKLEAQ